MKASVGRLVSLLVLLAMGAGTVPRAAAPHCGVDDQAPTHPSHHHDAAGTESAPAPQNTGSAEQCPHCPPVECRRHVDCAASVDSAVLEAAAPAPPAPAGAAIGPAPRIALGQPLAPPTPPPQRLL